LIESRLKNTQVNIFLVGAFTNFEKPKSQKERKDYLSNSFLGKKNKKKFKFIPIILLDCWNKFKLDFHFNKLNLNF
jgi:hypothetical protein